MNLCSQVIYLFALYTEHSVKSPLWSKRGSRWWKYKDECYSSCLQELPIYWRKDFQRGRIKKIYKQETPKQCCANIKSKKQYIKESFMQVSAIWAWRRCDIPSKAVAGVRTGLETGSNLSTDTGTGKVWRMLELGGGQASGLPQGCIVRRQELRSGGDGDHWRHLNSRVA